MFALICLLKDELHHEGPIGDSEDVASAAGTSSAVPEVNKFEETAIGEGGPKLVTVNTSREVLDEPTSTGLDIDSKRTGEAPDEPKLLTNDTSSAVPISGDRNTDSKETGMFCIYYWKIHLKRGFILITKRTKQSEKNRTNLKGK